MGAESDWEPRAVCRRLEPELFFEPATRSLAKAACARCPVRAECLDAVLIREEGLRVGDRSGIFAGLLPGQRVALAKRRAAQTPPAQ
ncbi:WhiB family transcriptional regulator [Streptomyces sp. NPDC102279]|uniref:WhiB family transcriptional regulator n=1 Tax=Streptomyces sp. NPDC102279 TaxID=3366153 RepID=UPI0037F13B70